jgi:hypothetical protein
MKRNEVMKISSILRDLLAGSAGHAEAYDAGWREDPYAHPAICAMTERERADLPPVHMPAPRPAPRSGASSRVLRTGFATCA